MKEQYKLNFIYVGLDRGNPIFEISSEKLPDGLISVIQRFGKLYQIEIV